MLRVVPALFKFAAGAMPSPNATAKSTGPASHTLSKPQQFPAMKPVAANTTLTPLPPVFKHPSGALQLGKIQYSVPVRNNITNTANTAASHKILQDNGYSPGREHGAGVLRISQHGGGLGQYNYAAPSAGVHADQYEVGNPGLNASGRPITESRLQIGSRAALLNPAGPEILPPTKQNFPDAEARYVQSQLWNNRRRAAEAADTTGPALPAAANPHTLISDACNSNPAGCTPATYARWLNAERGMHAGYAKQLANLPAADEIDAGKPPTASPAPTVFDRIKAVLGFSGKPAAPTSAQAAPSLVAPTPPKLSPLNLNKVVMTPPGYLGLGTAKFPAFGDWAGSFGNPYKADKNPRGGAAAHEYRLTQGGDPMREQHWTDTGIYTDARETPTPFVGLADEAKEFGRHIGLSPELGGGDANSYLDKIRDINNNPDATYWQKVRSNFARPIGSAIQFGREVSGLGQDVGTSAAEAARRAETVNRRVLGPGYLPAYSSSQKAGASVKEAKTLYHGSTRPNLAELAASQPNLGAAGVYGADNLDWAALYALAKDRRGMAVLGGAQPKLLINKANELAPEGYVYEYAAETPNAPPVDDPNRGWHIGNSATPLRKHIVKLVDHLKNIEQFDDKESLQKRWKELTQQKQADLKPEVNLQPHQERIQETVTEDSPRMLVYHGLGSGKSLSAIAAAEAAKKKYQEDYGIVAPASLRQNFQKEVEKFTQNSKPEILSYTGLGLGKKFTKVPETLIMDEAHRLRNPGGSAAQAAADVANQAKRVLLLTGSPITNSPSDLANLISIVARKNISPQEFEKKYVGYKKVYPGLFNYFAGIKPGDRAVIKNEGELRELLKGRVDYQPSKTPEGVNVNEEKITVPLTSAQSKIQQALRTKIPPGFLWKLDQEFPLSKDELAKLNSFLTGLRQNSVSTRPFRVDNDAFKSFQQSGKLQEAYKRLSELLESDPRKKAIIYSNHIGAGIEPYAAALAKYNVPHGIFHGGVPTKQRQKSLADYNAGKLRALLIGPAGAEGLSTKGTNLIQLLDPHWHESRTQQARGRGLRFDSHDDLPEELKNVHVQRFISKSEEPSFLGKLMGYRRERTGDEILERLSNEKEKLNERFRELLRELGTPKDQAPKTAAYEFGKAAGFRWYKRFPVNENLALNLSFGGPSLTVRKIIPGTSMTFGNRAPRLYVGTPIPGVAYQQYLSLKKHKIKAEKEFKDDPEDSRSTWEKIKDFLFGSDYKDAD